MAANEWIVLLALLVGAPTYVIYCLGSRLLPKSQRERYERWRRLRSAQKYEMWRLKQRHQDELSHLRIFHDGQRAGASKRTTPPSYCKPSPIEHFEPGDTERAWAAQTIWEQGWEKGAKE